MSRSSAATKEARVKPSRGQVNLCGACGTEISASELLCKDCRGTLGKTPQVFEDHETGTVFYDRHFS